MVVQRLFLIDQISLNCISEAIYRLEALEAYILLIIHTVVYQISYNF